MTTLTLLRKELGDLSPYLWLILLSVLYLVVEVAREHLDAVSLAGRFEMSQASGLLYALIGFAIGTGISNREREEGTLSFIDGLPVRRAHFFAVKIVAAWMVLFSGTLLTSSLAIGLHVMSRGSLDHQIHFGVLLTGNIMNGLLLLVALLFGAAFGLFRSLVWAMLGLAMAGLTVLTERFPRATALNPLRLIEPGALGTRWNMDWELVGVQIALALLLGGAALVGFLKAGLPPRSRVSRRPLISFVILVFTLGALGFSIMYMLWSLSVSESNGPAGEIGFSRSPPASTATRYYRFSYPAHRSSDALALAGLADEIFEEVHRLFGEPPTGSIEVDLSGSKEHTAGTAFHGRIRMHLEDQALRVLAHETAHVVAGRIVGSRSDLWKRAIVLNEGIATLVEQRYGDSEVREARRMILAASLYRRQLSLESMSSFGTFESNWDGSLKYPAGEAIVETMVDLYGEESVGRLLRAFGDDSLPSTLSGQKLWFTVFQKAGMDLPRVLDATYRGLEADLVRLEEVIRLLPRLVPRLVADQRRIGVVAEADGEVPEGWHMRVRFRNVKGNPGESVVVRPGQTLWRDRSVISGGRVCLQAGLAHGGYALYEEWTCIRISEALPIER